MRERKTGRLLALLLVAALLLSLLPATVLAVEPGAATTSNGDSFMRIVHLDCGRKYFTVDWVKSLIDKMAEYGYTHLELAFGNDGLRFLLDDMSVGAYTSDQVKSAIQQGNKDYYDAGDANEWSETEMTQIIDYAEKQGISIIPLLNTPGHMNAIVSAMGQLGISNAGFTPAGYTTSKNTIDLENPPAVAFTQALVKKYVDYFKSKNCDYFNLGADEYANDSLVHYSGMGFGYLSDNNLYSKFVTYVNTLADYVTSKDMTPIVFNDGVCYNNVDSPTISNNVLVSYWSCGWSGYDVAPASFLREEGYSLINTHGNFYYVLKSNQSSKPDMWHNSTDNAIDAASWDNNTFMARDGKPNISDPVGSMFCIWCDEPGVESEATIAQNVIDGGILSYMASAMKGEQINPPTEENPDYTNKVTISLAEGETKSIYVQGDDLSGETYNPYPTGYVNVNVTYTPGEIITADGYWERVTEGVAGIVSGQEYLIIANEESDGKDGGHVLTTTGGTANISANQGTKIPDSAVEDTYKFVITKTNGGYTLKGTTGFLYPDASWSDGIFGFGRGWTYSISKSERNSQDVSITENTTANTFKISRNVVSQNKNTTAQLNYEEDRWSATINASKNGHPFFLYRYVPGEATQEPGTNTIIFTGLKEGDASVVIGDTMYTIEVTPQSLVGVDELTIEYWITNGRTVDASGNNQIDISASNVYTEAGVDVTEFVPEHTTKENRTLQYWRCRLLDTSKSNNSNSGTEEQTEDSGDDETYNGREFTKVRYWNDTWSVYCVDKDEWVDVERDHQLVAYYLEILPVADELLVNAADWGKKGDGSTSGDYLEPTTACTVSVQVIYEDSTTNPNGTSAADLKSRTIAYGYWDGGRGIGTLNLNGLEGYQIWKIEAETGSHTGTGTATGEDAAWGGYVVNHFEWDNNPVTVYEGDPVDSYVIHNDANNPTRTGIYENLMWDENKESILIKVYVKAPVTKDSLTVHYLVDGTNVQFYQYQIGVVAGTLFNEGIALNTANPNGPLLNGTVKNVFGTQQTVTADLKTMSEIGAQYRYSNFDCVKVERSDDGKDVYLYYTFQNTHDFVIDFGLPLNISAEKLGLTAVNWDGATVNKNCNFGSASIDTSAKTITYTPNKVLTTADTITLTFTDVNGVTVSHQIYIYPASNVLYEETFLTEATNMGTDYAPWTHSGDAATTAQSALQTSLYGYDDAYKYSTDNSMGSDWTISGLTAGNGSKYLTTTFYGNAFDLIGTAGPDTGFVYLMLTGRENRMVIIDTSYVDGKDTTLYQVPLAHEVLEEGEYTAYIRGTYRAATDGSSDAASKSAASTFSLMSASSPLDEVYEVLAEFERDGFVIDDIEFVSVDENSVLSESADAQVSLFSVPATDSDTDTTAAKSALARPKGTTVTIDGFRVYREAIDSDFAAAYAQAKENEFHYVNILDALEDQDLTEIAYVEGNADGYTPKTYEASGGPQNELYLKPNASITINFVGEGTAQFSARMVGSGNSEVSVMQSDGSSATHYIMSNTEMYYSVHDTGTVTIMNISDDMLALGNLKMTGNVTLSVLSEEEVQAACLMLASAFPVDPGETEEPGDIEEPEVPVEPETPAVFEPAKLDVKVNSTKVLFNKLVTVTVSASSDVDKLTINGKTLYPTNSLLVKWGLSKTYTYIYVDTVKRSESKSYEIVAYNDAGLASAPDTVQG